MKPREKKPEIVYRIINRETGAAVGSYSRAYCDYATEVTGAFHSTTPV